MSTSRVPLPTPPDDAVAALEQAFTELGLRTTTTENLFRVETGARQPVSFSLTCLAAPTRDAVERRMDEHRSPKGATPLLISNRISDSVRSTLKEAGWGWLDRRGHLRATGHGLFVDTDVTPSTPTERDERNVLATDVGIAVAIHLLLNPRETHTIRPLAAAIGRSSSAVGAAIQELRKQSLIRSNGLPLTPELFWEVSAEWRPKVSPLARRPRLDHPDVDYRIDPEDLTAQRPGWCLTNTVAAHSWGAPLTTTAETPPRFIVPTSRDLRIATSTFGTPDRYDQRAASIIVAPIPAAVQLRYLPRGRAKKSRQWPLAHPLFVALALSRDKARGSVSPGWWCDDSKAAQELGYRPRFPLTDGLEHTVEWLREQRWL